MIRYGLSRNRAVSITDAEPSFEDEQRIRRRHYSILMVVHIVGFALGGLLYYQAWWLGLLLIIATTPLPWIAVVIANGPRLHRGARPQRLPSRMQTRTELPSGGGWERTGAGAGDRE